MTDDNFTASDMMVPAEYNEHVSELVKIMLKNLDEEYALLVPFSDPESVARRKEISQEIDGWKDAQAKIEGRWMERQNQKEGLHVSSSQFIDGKWVTSRRG